MLTRVFLSLALLVAIPAWSQVSTTDGGVGLAMTDQMQTPPPVSGEAYPTRVGSEKRSNYLRAGLTVVTAYSDNVLGNDDRPISELSYSIWPTIAFDKTISRLHWSLTYNPGFTIYQRTRGFDQTNQNVALDFLYRLSPHVTVTVQDSFIKTSNVFNQPEALSEGAISGSGQSPLIPFIAPFANVLSNSANAAIRYQFSRNSMIGANVTFTNLDYQTTVPGLNNSSSSGGSAFYSRRLSRNQYIGATYQYSEILAYSVNTRIAVQTNTVAGFYTIYLNRTFSLSFSGGQQHYGISESTVPASGLWSPTLGASMGWQGQRTNFSASYSRAITAGGGLIGAFQTNSVSASAQWQLARTWNLGSAASYSNNKNVTPAAFISTPAGGHFIIGTVSVQHPVREHFNVGFGYTRLHQTYPGIPLISNAPNANREFVSVAYQFARPLGR